MRTRRNAYSPLGRGRGWVGSWKAPGCVRSLEFPDTHSQLAAHGVNVLFVAPFTRREDSARFFAAKNTAENVTVAAHPGVNFFGDPDYAGNPEDEREWNQPHGISNRMMHAAFLAGIR